jgi:hypothetical protein
MSLCDESVLSQGARAMVLVLVLVLVLLEQRNSII